LGKPSVSHASHIPGAAHHWHSDTHAGFAAAHRFVPLSAPQD